MFPRLALVVVAPALAIQAQAPSNQKVIVDTPIVRVHLTVGQRG